MLFRSALKLTSGTFKRVPVMPNDTPVIDALGLPPEPAMSPPPPPPMRVGDRGATATPIELFSLAARLQLMQGLAILGWAAFILKMLGV